VENIENVENFNIDELVADAIRTGDE